MNPEDLEAVAEQVRRGEDDFVIPQDLVEEQPVAVPPPRNLRAQIGDMTVGERLKLALKGNRDARSILIRDQNRLVQKFVLQNPRLTDEEIIALAKNRNLETELLDWIIKNREWTRNYQVRLALVTNPKTPLAEAIRFVSTLLERDIRALAKNKNVASAVNGVARRIILERRGGGRG